MRTIRTIIRLSSRLNNFQSRLGRRPTRNVMFNLLDRLIRDSSRGVRHRGGRLGLIVRRTRVTARVRRRTRLLRLVRRRRARQRSRSWRRRSKLRLLSLRVWLLPSLPPRPRPPPLLMVSDTSSSREFDTTASSYDLEGRSWLAEHQDKERDDRKLTSSFRRLISTDHLIDSEPLVFQSVVSKSFTDVLLVL